MKCPNCSFVNSDDIKTCRVCGFDLTPNEKPTVEETSSSNDTSESAAPIERTKSVEMPVTSDNKISKRRMIDASEDEALDSAFKSIFGVDDDFDEDPLDVATVERFLQKKRNVQTLDTQITNHGEVTEPISSVNEYKDKDIQKKDNDLEAEAGVEDDDEIDVVAFETDPLDDDEALNPLSNKKVILMVVLLLLLLILLTLKIFGAGLPWKYESDNETTESTILESTEVPDTTEAAFTLGDDASLVPVNDFFNLLPEYINRGNLSILGLFENSQEALEVLSSFALIGNLEKITEASITQSKIAEDSATYTVRTLTNRLIDGQQTQTASIWDFRALFKNNIWILESMAVETGVSVDAETTEALTQTTEKPTEATTEKQTATTEAPTTTSENSSEEVTTETTSETLLNGFKSTGSFSGGTKSSGQDVAFARHGNHDSYERLAFDMYNWVGGKPTQSVNVISSYSATISDDGLLIGIIISGATEAYASQSSLNLTNSANIKSVYYNYYGDGDAVAITIELKQPSQFKVFSLETPAKLVIDIAPLK